VADPGTGRCAVTALVELRGPDATLKEPPPPRCPDHGRYEKTCEACRVFSRWRSRNYHRRCKLGLHVREKLVDAGPALTHLRQLRGAGMPLLHIAARAGVGKATLCDLLAATTPGMVKEDTAAAILGTRLRISPYAPVDVTGTRRRVEALARAGWTRDHIGAAIGRSSRRILEWIRGGTVPAGMAEAVKRFYDQNVYRKGPSSEVAALARGKRWHSHWAWDDDTIDDPAAEPIPHDRTARHEQTLPDRSEVDPTQVLLAITGGLPQVDLTTAERVEVVTYLRRQQWEWKQIAEHLRWSDTPDRSLKGVIRFAQTHRLFTAPRELVAA
jgi:hypothetical protein